MDREIHKLNQLVSLMPYRNDKNRTDGVNVGSGLPCTSLEEVNLLTKISEYFVKLTGEVLSENFLNGDLGIGGVKRVRKEDRFDRNIHMARLELKKLDAQIGKLNCYLTHYALDYSCDLTAKIVDFISI